MQLLWKWLANLSHTDHMNLMSRGLTWKYYLCLNEDELELEHEHVEIELKYKHEDEVFLYYTKCGNELELSHECDAGLHLKD